MASNVIRPTCECHGKPMTKSGFTPAGKQQWRCAHKRRAESRDNYQRNADARRAYGRRYNREQREKRADFDRHSNLRRLYGITPEDYDQMVMTQCGLCAICGEPETVKKGMLAVDHDHDTGEIRGLLCARCNSGLGLLQDDPERVTSALAYLGGVPSQAM